MVCEASNQELIAEAVRVTSAPQERQYASHFRVRVNHDFARRSQARYDRPMKFGPIAIHGRIDGIKHLDAKQRSEEHTSELQSLTNLVCRLLLEKKKKQKTIIHKNIKKQNK